jgi:hypothetical protein
MTREELDRLIEAAKELYFVECDSCRAKPGSPTLCVGCRHNRWLFNKLKASFYKSNENFCSNCYTISIGFAMTCEKHPWSGR